MLDFVLLSAIVLQAATVEVFPARVRLVVNEARLHKVCAVEGKLDACTTFVGYRLEATCSNDRAGWRISASARFMPRMFLLKGGGMMHEYNHIEDVRQSVERYLAELEGTVLQSSEVCQEAVVREQAGFKTRMKQFARDSNVKWHPHSNLRFLNQDSTSHSGAVNGQTD